MKTNLKISRSEYSWYLRRWTLSKRLLTKKKDRKKMDSARRNFYFLGASIFISLPLGLRNINSRVFFRKTLDDYYM